MAKRFVSTELWDEDWFLQMPIEYKLFWFYLITNCDHAGIFKVNVTLFNLTNGIKIDTKLAYEYYNFGKDRIRIISENQWLIEDFFVYQYGNVFNPNNRVHDSIEKVYVKHGLKMTSIRGLKDLKDRVKDKDKDKYKSKNNNTVIKVIGEKICENLEFVYFSDGTKQKLGEEQKQNILTGFFKARDIVKGSIF